MPTATEARIIELLRDMARRLEDLESQEIPDGTLTFATPGLTLTVNADTVLNGSPPTGTGTTGRVAEWSSSSALTASTLAKSGAGLLTLSAATAETLTIIDGGSLDLGGFTLTLLADATLGGPSLSGSGTTGRITQWTGTTALGDSTLAKTGAGLLTLDAAAAETLTIADGGTLNLGGFTLTLTADATLGGSTLSGSGTTGRITQWTGATALGDSTLAKTGAGLLTLDASAAETLTIADGGTLNLGGFTLTLAANATLNGTPPSGSGTAGRIPEWTTSAVLGDSTLAKTGAGVLTLDAGAAYTLTVPATGTATLGTGTSGRVAEWSGTNTVQASTLAKTGAGVLTLSAATAETLTIIDGGSLDLGGFTLTLAANATLNGTPPLGSGTSGRIAQWSATTTLGDSTLAKTGVGLLTLDAGATYTLTVPATGTVALGTGTSGRVTEWSGTNTVQASTLAKTGVGVLTLSAATAETLTVADGGSLNLGGFTLTLTADATLNGTPPTGSGTSGRVAEWSSSSVLAASTLAKTGAGLLTLSAGSAYTLTVPATGTATLGTGTTGRVAEWSDTNTVQASTLAKTGAGVLTLSASTAETLTVTDGGSLDLGGFTLTLTASTTLNGTPPSGSGTTGRMAEWSSSSALAASTLAKTGAGVLTLSAGSAYTLTVPATGTATLGTGTTGRVAEWSGTNTVQASTLAKTGAGVLTLNATTTETLTIADGGILNLGGFTFSVPGNGPCAMGTGAAGGVAYWTGNNTISVESAVFFWDDTNNRLGVGTSSPQTSVHVVGGDTDGVTCSTTGTSSPNFRMVSSTNHWCLDNSSGALRIFTETGYNTGGVVRAQFASNGRFGLGVAPSNLLHLVSDDAAKPSTNTWTVSSDLRTKEPGSIRPYTPGIDLIRQLRPVHFRYNGLGGTPAGEEAIGFTAQALERIAPRLVRRAKGKLHPDDPVEVDILALNTSELQYAVYNALRELDARLTALEGG